MQMTEEAAVKMAISESLHRFIKERISKIAAHIADLFSLMPLTPKVSQNLVISFLLNLMMLSTHTYQGSRP